MSASCRCDFLGKMLDRKGVILSPDRIPIGRCTPTNYQQYTWKVELAGTWNGSDMSRLAFCQRHSGATKHMARKQSQVESS